MKRDDTEFKALTQRLVAGELTRQEACDIHGIKYNTLCQWLKRSKVVLPEPSEKFRADAPRYGAALGYPKMDEATVARLNGALEEVMAGGISCLAAAEKFNVNAGTLTNKVRSLRLARNIPIVRVRSKNKPKPA